MENIAGESQTEIKPHKQIEILLEEKCVRKGFNYSNIFRGG